MPESELSRLDVFAPAYAVGCPLGNQPLPTLGEAKAVLRGYRERIGVRTQYLGARTHSDKDSAQMRLG